MRANQKRKYLGEFFPLLYSNGQAFLDFFQTEKYTGNSKGILLINLSREAL